MDRRFSVTVGSSGSAVVTMRPSGSLPWVVSQVSVEMANAPGEATCVVRKNGFLVSPAVASADAVAGDPPIELQPGDELTVEWANATPGDVGKVLAFYELGDR